MPVSRSREGPLSGIERTGTQTRGGETRRHARHFRQQPWGWARRLDGLLSLPVRGLLLCYRYLISPLLPPRCRFAPSCSAYALEALQRHGFLVGGSLALRRVVRCHPWGGCGYDPVPNVGGPCRHRAEDWREPQTDASQTIGRPL